MNCLIVDDEVMSRGIIKEMISLDPALNLVSECADVTHAYKVVLNNQIDLVFLDINLPDITGLDFAKTLKDKNILVILITSESEHAVEAYNLNVVDFMVKPVNLSRFYESVQRAKDIYTKSRHVESIREDDFIFVRVSYIIKKIYLNEILYIEAKDNYSNIHLADSYFAIHSPIKHIEQKLSSSLFLRVHRSFIINFSKIDSIEGKTVIISKYLIPVSDNYRIDLNKRLQIL